MVSYRAKTVTIIWTFDYCRFTLCDNKGVVTDEEHSN